MSRRCLIVLGVVLGVVLAAFTLSASADPTTPTVQREAWAWIAQRDVAPPLGMATGVREGQLPVAWIGREEKVTFLEVAPRLDPGSPLTMRLAVDGSGTNRAVDEADIVICAVTEAWQTGSPMAWERQPARACERASPGVYQPASNDFFFDLSELIPVLAATGWHGVVVAPDPATAAPAFQVVFASAVGGGAEIDAAAPPGAGAPTRDDRTAPPSPPGGNDAAAPVEIAPGPLATSAPPDHGDPVPSSTGDTDAAAPTTAAASLELLEDVATRPERQQRPASFAGFYAAMAALAMLLTARPVLTAASGVLRVGTGHELIRAGHGTRRAKTQ